MPEPYQPLRVHLESAEPGVLPGAAPHKKIMTRFVTETVDNQNTVRPLLPDTPGRVLAIVQVSGGDVHLCDTQGHAQAAAGGQGTSELGTRIPAGTAPWPLLGEGAVWIAQVTAGTTCTVACTADYKT